jgi:hypothetical protein
MSRPLTAWLPGRSKARHRRIRRLEFRVDAGDADRAQIREELREIKACLLVMGAPLEGEIPPLLTCAIISGSGGPVTLDVDGKPVIANLDPEHQGDVVEIWQAIRHRAGGLAAS